jgi:sterol desaturase/sphingolipid hydroxylase (fatty acid hydroxylase superfamily)
VIAELLATTGASFALLAAVFVPLERAFPARPSQPVLRRDVVVDACFFLGQYLLFSGASLAILGWLAPHLALAPRSLAALPLAAQGALALLLGDLCVYGWHRACHAVPLLWRFHAVHHSSEELDWLAAHREHPLDGLTTQLAVNLPGIVLGVPLHILAPIAVLRGMWAIFVHSNVRLPLGPLRVVLGAPELHHWHHARNVAVTKNFANLAPWVDLLFGTYERPRDDGTERYALGVTMDWPTARGPRGWLAQLARPFRK